MTRYEFVRYVTLVTWEMDTTTFDPVQTLKKAENIFLKPQNRIKPNI
jgi:hypothetical protein